MVAWLDLVGLLLVLASSFVKLFFSDTLSDLHRSVIQVRIEQKLDYIFLLLGHHHRRSHPEDSHSTSTLNLDGIEQDWMAPSAETLAGRQASRFGRAENVAFLLGSLLLIAAKLLPLVWPHSFAGE